MYNICNVLNQIGDFCLRIGEKKLELTGTLIKKDNNVILEARTVKENLKYIREDNNRAFQICGTVSGIEVTLLNCVASVRKYFGRSNRDYYWKKQFGRYRSQKNLGFN